MKKIIERGYPNLRLYENRCGNCGCLFQYTKDELYENKNILSRPLSVKCPWCLMKVRIDSLESVK